MSSVSPSTWLTIDLLWSLSVSPVGRAAPCGALCTGAFCDTCITMPRISSGFLPISRPTTATSAMPPTPRRIPPPPKPPPLEDARSSSTFSLSRMSSQRTSLSLLRRPPGCRTRQTLQSLPGLVPSAHAGRPEKCLRVPRTPGSIEAGPIGRGAPGPAGNLLSEAARAVSWRLTHASCATAITLARPLRLPCNHSRVLPCACLLRPLPIRPIRRRCRDLPSRRAMPPRRRQR